MVLKKTAKRLAGLYDTLKSNGGAKIKSSHVEEILARIEHKQRKTLRDLEDARSEAERAKLTRRLAVIEEQRNRSEELLRLVRNDGH